MIQFLSWQWRHHCIALIVFCNKWEWSLSVKKKDLERSANTAKESIYQLTLNHWWFLLKFLIFLSLSGGQSQYALDFITTYSMKMAITTKITDMMKHLECLSASFGSWNFLPPHFPQHRQQQKHIPTNGITSMNNTPKATATMIGVS